MHACLLVWDTLHYCNLEIDIALIDQDKMHLIAD
jgi:hypothetical protein